MDELLHLKTIFKLLSNSRLALIAICHLNMTKSLHAWLQFHMKQYSFSLEKRGRIKSFCHFCPSTQLFSQRNLK